MKKVLVTDLDGTLIYSDNNFQMISKENVKMLKDFNEAGGRVVVCTSRNANFSYSVEHKLGFRCDYVCNDGAYIEADGKTMSEHFISSQLVNDIKDEVEAQLSLSDDLEYQQEVLMRYGIIDKKTKKIAD